MKTWYQFELVISQRFNQLSKTAVVAAMLLVQLLFGCSRPAKYIKSSAANGGPEDPAILAIENAGGTCFRYDELRGLLVEKDRFWLKDVTGNPIVCVEIDDCQRASDLLVHISELKQIQSLCMRRCPLNDQDAGSISQMKNLRKLRLENTHLTLSGISELATLRLEHLNFDFNNVGDEGLKVLSSIDTLRELYLHGSMATDAGYAHLAQLSQLRFLQLGNTKITDAGLVCLSGLDNLAELSIINSGITGVGFQSFTNSNIRNLQLNYCDISANGLKGIANLSMVEELSLFSSSLTDSGLEELASMPNLVSLDIYGNSVTNVGLRKLLPSKSLIGVNVTDCQITEADCKRFARDSERCNAFIVYD